MIDADTCTVWWATPEAPHDALATLLDPAEKARVEQLRRPADRVRRLLGTAVLRLAAGAATGTAPTAVRIERHCPTCPLPHGKPTLPGTGLHASVSHSGDRIAVALTAAGPVGVDVEQVHDVDVAALAPTVLHPSERATDLAGFFRYWTRKEATVKATGDGITLGLHRLHVSAPDTEPALIAYPDRPGLAAQLRDLAPDPGYAAALAVLSTAPPRVRERPASDLL
ncbi:4'-phosphopantetheinyl transferase [Virgisporangium aliadipatigenens]|uniref:4'-phosphopantetheinyl transferase n=1 Tax=Virgisporangium aliadipatigenens TaxID=741659 RepID=A0A8J3YJ69_9ACTN|nr:4'-phosphopantetheinyl transferase superfamily protein [Virgisporangium aliadipatigenens]GIJ46294.1 4'-phosphopantetheinyl transferase [Virgisporangium aliadipatigenens]